MVLSRVQPLTVLSQFKKYKNYIINNYGFSLKSLSVFRVSVGVCLVINWFMRVQDAFVHYSDQGILNTSFDLKLSNIGSYSLLFINNHRFWVVVVFIASLLSFLGYLFGYKTKLFTVLSLIFLLTLQNKFYLGNHSGDDLLKFILFWSLWLPIDKYYSINSIRKPTGKKQVVISFVTVAFLIQLALIYFVAYASKTGSLWRETFQGLEYTFNIEYFTSSLGEYLLRFPGLLSRLTAASIYIELILPVLILTAVFVRTSRYFAFGLGLALHLGIMLTMRVGIFPYISIAMMIPLLPNSFWEPIERKLSSIAKSFNLELVKNLLGKEKPQLKAQQYVRNFKTTQSCVIRG